MSERILIHFQEGFTGEDLELWRGEERVGHWPLQTRLQIGLARIEPLDVEPGDSLRISLPDRGLQARFAAPTSAGAHVFLVNFDGQELRVTAAEDEPGYL